MNLEALQHGAGKTATRSRYSSWVDRRFQCELERAGITVNGPEPWDPQVRNPQIFARILIHGTLGAGEGYVDGDWDCASLDEFVSRLLASRADERWEWPSALSLHTLFAHVANLQSRARARRNVTAHYDIGDELYAAMLGPAMTYSCGYWRDAGTLEEAQNAKHELVCRKLSLRPGMRVLDIGCGWGGFAKHAAERYGAHVVGVTLSPAQAAYATKRCADLPVEIRLLDYRDIRGVFDRIVSIGMFEHVGPKNYREFFASVQGNLASDGLFLLHSIGGLRSVATLDPWMARYIFPNAVLPSATQIQRATEGLFVLEDWHNFGAYYDKTLMAWHANFVSAWPSFRHSYGDRFARMWRYYLLTCAGSFRARRNQLWQVVFSKRGVPGGYLRAGA